jgi:hypothetical protein
MSEWVGETDALPIELSGTCEDCGTTMTVAHPEGLGGSELPWRCPVCLYSVDLTPPDARS